MPVCGGRCYGHLGTRIRLGRVDNSRVRFTPRSRPLATPSAIRVYRQHRGVRLIEVAVWSGKSLTRLSELERHPEFARTGEIKLVQDTIDHIVAERERLPLSGDAA
jgi:hypothetical protein